MGRFGAREPFELRPLSAGRKEADPQQFQKGCKGDGVLPFEEVEGKKEEKPDQKIVKEQRVHLFRFCGDPHGKCRDGGDEAGAEAINGAAMENARGGLKNEKYADESNKDRNPEPMLYRFFHPQPDDKGEK